MPTEGRAPIVRAATPLRKLITWLVVTLALVGSGVLSADLAGAATQTYSTVGTVPVRAGKATSSAQLGSLPKGAHVLATGKASGDWQPIRYESRTGYVQRRYLKADAKPATRFTTGPSGRKTTTARVYLRTGASLSSSIVRTYSKGAVVEVTGISGGDYTQVKADGTAGWMATRLLSKTTSTRPATVAGYTATTTLALRASASVSASSLASVAVGTRVDGTGTHSGGYTQVVFRHPGRLGDHRLPQGRVRDAKEVCAAAAPRDPLHEERRHLADGRRRRVGRPAAKLGKDQVLRATGATKNSYTAVIWNGSVVWTASSSLTTKKPAIVDLGSTSLNKLQTYPKLAVLAIRDKFPQISTMYGWRASSSYSEDHPSGRAVDVMIPSYKTNKALGDKVAQYLIDNAKKLHVNYVIWRQRSYSIERGTWKKMDDRGGDTANHYDHVHVSFFQTP